MYLRTWLDPGLDQWKYIHACMHMYAYYMIVKDIPDAPDHHCKLISFFQREVVVLRVSVLELIGGYSGTVPSISYLFFFFRSSVRSSEPLQQLIPLTGTHWALTTVYRLPRETTATRHASRSVCPVSHTIMTIHVCLFCLLTL